jgi:hypothetical protein
MRWLIDFDSSGRGARREAAGAAGSYRNGEHPCCRIGGVGSRCATTRNALTAADVRLAMSRRRLAISAYLPWAGLCGRRAITRAGGPLWKPSSRRCLLSASVLRTLPCRRGCAGRRDPREDCHNCALSVQALEPDRLPFAEAKRKLLRPCGAEARDRRNGEKADSSPRTEPLPSQQMDNILPL